MNTGIADAVDLSWKLEAVVGGWGGPELLRSYGIERKPVAEPGREGSKRQFGTHARGAQEGTTGGRLPARSGGRRGAERVCDWYTETMKREWYSTGIHLGFDYYHSPVVYPDNTPAPPDEVSNYVQTARAGHRAPHAWLKDGRSTLEPVRPRLRAALLLSGLVPWARASLRRQEYAGFLCWSLISATKPGSSELYGANYVLVRPDGHVAWRDKRAT